jgi:hypothetical protein
MVSMNRQEDDMAQLTVSIDLDGAAFDPEPGPEVARILKHLADTFRDTLVIAPRGPEPLSLRDINGNACGEVTLKS